MKDLVNRGAEVPVVLITGASSGIGRATAVLLAERGWSVFAAARKVEALSDLAGERIAPLRLDVTDEASAAAAVERVLAEAGRIDALVNSAGYAQLGPLEELTADEVRDQFETNTFGPLRMAQLVLPAMRAQGGGRLVNVSSMGGRVAHPFTGAYNASKFAIEGLSDALRLEVRPFGVRVVLVEPGSIRTNFNEVAIARAQRFVDDERSPYGFYFERFLLVMARTTPRGSSPARVATVIHRALTAPSPRARYVAGPDARVMVSLVAGLPSRTRDALLTGLTGLRGTPPRPADGVEEASAHDTTPAADAAGARHPAARVERSQGLERRASAAVSAGLAGRDD